MSKQSPQPVTTPDQFVIPGEEIQVVPQSIFLKREHWFGIFILLISIGTALLTISAKIYPYFPIDLVITRTIQWFDPAWFNFLMEFITFLGNSIPANIFILGTVLFLSIHKRVKEGIFLLVSSYGAIIIATIGKLVISRERPDPSLVRQVSEYLHRDSSFPSGHVLFYMGFFGFLLYLTYAKLPKSKLRASLIILFSLLLVLIGPSRMYVGAHWFSDVTGAYLIGTLWLIAVVSVYNKFQKRIQMNMRLILAFLLFTVLLVILVNTVPLQELKKIATFPLGTALLLLGVSYLTTILKAFRLLLLMHTVKIPSTFLQTLKLYTASEAITPLPGGELMRSVLIKKETDASIAKSTGPVATQAFLEILSAALLTIVGSLFFGILRLPTLTVIIVMIGVLILSSSKRLLFKTQRLTRKITFMKKFADVLPETQKNIKASIFKKSSYFPNTTFLVTLGIAILTNIVGGMIIFLITDAYNLSISFPESIFIYSSSIVISALAGFIPGGFGLMEGGMMGIFLALGTPYASAILVVILFRLATLVFRVLLGLLLMRIFYYQELINNK